MTDLFDSHCARASPYTVKIPPAFDIDLHVDDSEGVRIEGDDHGFRVVVVHPQDENWAQAVLDAVAGVQAQFARQQMPRYSKKGDRFI